MNWLTHLLGMDNGSGPFYLSESGWMGLLGFLGIVGTLLRKHNCEVTGCWRLGRHQTAAGHSTCRRHHPDDKLTAQDVLRAHEEAR